MKRHLLLLLAAVFTLSACAPFAEWTRDQLDTGEPGTLTYVEQGLRFDPGDSKAQAVVLRVDGVNLKLLALNVECPTITATQIQCNLGDLMEPMTVNLTGQDVLASASYWRVGSPDPLVAYAR